MIRRENWLLTEKYLSDFTGENPNACQATIERYEFSLRHLLRWADDMTFEQAINTKEPYFSTYVKNLPARRGDGNLAEESQKKIIVVSKAFLEWARDVKAIGAKKITTRKLKGLVHSKVTTSNRQPESVSFEEILKITSFNFGDSKVFQRDLAGICFAFISGARAGAIATAPIKAINLEELFFNQDPSIGVETKNRKTAITFLLPIPELIAVVKRWDDFVRANLPDTAPWFAPFETHWGDYSLSSNLIGENRNQAISKRFGLIYERAGMKELYKSAHKFRHGHAVYGLGKCKTMAEYQALSRNLMHSSLETTDSIYAVMESRERQNIISRFIPNYQPAIESDLEQYLNSLCREDKRKAFDILVNKLMS